MISGCIRAVALLAITALFTNAQCYGKCAIAACSPAQMPSGGCHHDHNAPEQDQQTCVHHHSDFTIPEAGMAKAGVANWVPTVAVLTVDSSSVLSQAPVVAVLDTGSPPDRLPSQAITVLRI